MAKRKKKATKKKVQDGQVRGETHGSAVLDDTIVGRCRKQVRAGKTTCAALARRYGVSQSAMYQAVHGYTWQHLDSKVKPVGYSGPYRGSRTPSKA